jgi:hypothetical protein
MVDQSNEMIGMGSAETSKWGPVAIAFSDAKCSSETSSSFGAMLLAIAVASRRSWRNAVTARSGKIRFPRSDLRDRVGSIRGIAARAYGGVG